jgi:iron complex transport system substrate-binding protein
MSRAIVVAMIAAVSARRPGAAVLAALALLLAAGPSESGTVLDMAGRPVVLPAPPRRIVSLVPSVTEIVFALGAADRLAAVTDFCDYPPAARGKPSVGGMLAPSLERIVALRADLVIVTDSGNREDTRDQLGRLGIPVYTVHAARLAEVMDVVARLGELTGRAGAVPPIVRQLQQRIDAVRTAVARHPRPRVLYVLWPEPLIVPARDALVTELIQVAGGHSVTAGEPGDYPRLSLETAVARAPEVIVLARHGVGVGPVERDRWDRLAALPAVKGGRVHEVDGGLLHRYGPRVVEGLERLARIIHPGAFR